MPVAVSLATAVAIQLLCQAYKVVACSIRDRRLRMAAFFSAGGMPSAHTAFVVSLSLSLGLGSGFDSDAFAVAAVFSTIVIYDILRLRHAVQRHTEVLERLVEDPRLAARTKGLRLPRPVGHTPAEVVAGALVGAAAAVAGHLALPR